MRCVVSGILVLLFCAMPIHAQGKLSEVRDRVELEDPPEPEEKKDDHDCDCDDDDEGNSFLGLLLWYALISPFVIPHAIADDAFEKTGMFPPYPYAEPYEGYLQRPLEMSDEDREPLRRFAGRFSVENGNDFDGLNRTNVSVLLETTSRFGIQSRFNYLTEDLDGGGTDEIFVGSTELIYRFAQCSKFQAYAGLGVRYLDDQSHTHAGFNFTYGVDVFPCDPVIACFILDLGTAGNAGVVHFRGTIGVIWQHVEVFAGYDFRSFDDVSIQGPLAGLRLWF